jgi:serine/threonine protein kinase
MKACPQCNLRYPGGSVSCFVDGVTLVEIQDPRIGTTIAGRYQIERVIGEGGMATVYGARHRLVDRPCAIKVMSRSFARDEVIRERFRREAKAAQKLAHPNIIEIFDQGELDDGTLYLVMELLDGEPLADVLDHGGKIPLERALPVAIQISRALARAHDLEVIHRDLKPENIYLARDDAGGDHVKLLDFGIARSMQDTRLTGAGEVFGTPQYMAPERITSIDAGPAADLYALGVILYEMFTGQLPFEARDVTGWFIEHLKKQPAPPRSKEPSLPVALDRLVLQLLAKNVEERPVDAHRVHADLMAVAGAIGVRIPVETAQQELSSQHPAATLPPVAIDQWARRTSLFDRMLGRLSPAHRSPQLQQTLGEVKAMVAEIAELRSRSVKEQRALEGIDTRGRETRQRFGHAVDALGVDASKARDELRNAVAAAGALAIEVDKHQRRAIEAQKNAVFWEGRSGFQEPYKELAEAYRAMANGVDAWRRIAEKHKEAEAKTVAKRSELSDLEFQIHELRGALAKQQENQDQEEAQKRENIEAMGRRADELENRLLDLATRFCAPLRSRPELRPLFQELEAGVA